MESEQATPVDSIKDVVRSSVKVPEFDKHLKKAGGHIGRNVVEITIKMKTIVRKPSMIKIIKLRLRIPKHEKHSRLLSSGTKPFITFELKGFSTKGERYTFFLFWLFHCPPPNACGARSAQIRLASASPESNWLFSNPPQILRARFRYMISFTSPGPGIFILTSVNDTSFPRARQHQCSSLHLTNPCTEPKGSQPN